MDKSPILMSVKKNIYFTYPVHTYYTFHESKKRWGRGTMNKTICNGENLLTVALAAPSLLCLEAFISLKLSKMNRLRSVGTSGSSRILYNHFRNCNHSKKSLDLLLYHDSNSHRCIHFHISLFCKGFSLSRPHPLH